MGLLQFFSNIGGSRVKEITPDDRCKWLEPPRPVTSGGARFTKRNISNPVLTDASSGVKSSVTADDKSSIFKGRSRGISLPRGKGERGWRRRKSLSGLQPDLEKDIPDLPVLPPEQPPPRESMPPVLIRPDRKEDEEFTRPGTAITTDESVQNEVFELPAESIFLPKAEEQASSETPPPIVTRKRSKSAASDKPRNKRASWFTSNRQKGSRNNLPPLPPPIDAERPKTADAAKPPPKPLPDPPISDTVPILPTTPGIRDSLGAASILRSFPSVPSFTQETPQTPPLYPPAAITTTTPTTSPSSDPLSLSPTSAHYLPRDSAVVTSPPTTRKQPPTTLDIHTNKPLPSAKSFSQPLSPMLTPDSWPRPPSNSAVSETRSARLSTKVPASPGLRGSNSEEGYFTSEQQREYYRVTRFLESMEGGGGGGRVSGGDRGGERERVHSSSSESEQWAAVQKFSNQEALAALEFEIAGEGK